LTRSRRVQARLGCADVQGISIEVLALVFARIGVISTIEDRICTSAAGTSTDLEIYTTVIITERKCSTKPGPLKSPFAIR